MVSFATVDPDAVPFPLPQFRIWLITDSDFLLLSFSFSATSVPRRLLRLLLLLHVSDGYRRPVASFVQIALICNSRFKLSQVMWILHCCLCSVLVVLFGGESSSSATGVTGAPPMGVMGPSSSVNQGYDDVEVYRPEFYPSESPIYPNFGENVNVQEMTNLSFSPEIMGGQSSDYLFTTPPPMPSVIEEDFNAEEDLNAQQRPQRN
ncbi:hypothetical protein GQ457_07G013710 [Hibiscus cannabinus]